MSSLELADVGRVAHLGVVVGVVAWVLMSLRSRVVSDRHSGHERRNRVLILVALIGLFGGTFRVTPLDTQGRLLVAGASLVLTFTLVALAVPARELLAKLIAPGPLRWMFAYSLASLPSIAVASDPLAAGGGAAGMLALVATTGAIALTFDRREIKQLVGVLAAAAVMLAVSGALLTPSDAIWTIRSSVLAHRFVGWFPFVGLGWGHLGVGLLIVGLGRSQWRWPALIAGLGLIVATQSRGAAIAALVVGVVWVALAHRRFLPLIIAALVATAIAGATIDPIREVWDREASLDEADSIFSYRADYIRAAVLVAETSPVIGRGIDSGTVDDFSKELTVGRLGRVESTTMAWTTAIAGTGLVGLGLLIATFVSAGRWAFGEWRSRSVQWPLLTMVWMFVSSFFIVGPGELSAQTIAFALLILATSASSGQRFSEPPASRRAGRRGFAASQ